MPHRVVWSTTSHAPGTHGLGLMDQLESLKYMSGDALYWMVPLYVISQPLLRAYVNKYDPYEKNKAMFKQIMGAYNFALSAYSCFSFVTMVYALCNLTTPLFTIGHYSESQLYKFTVWHFYISKYVEFFDTWFLILMKRDVGMLQLFHHMGAPIMMGLAYNHTCEAIWIVVAWNSFIHTWMYMYYACAALKIGGSLVRMLKQTLTTMQIAQLCTGLVLQPKFMQDGEFIKDGARVFTWWFGYVYVWVLVFLFAHFYLTTYVFKKKSSTFKKSD
jgi:hypothetical protein